MLSVDFNRKIRKIMSNFKKEGAKVVGLENIMDLNEIKNKISVYL